MRMGSTADFMRQRNPAYGPVAKALAIDQNAFGCSTIFVSYETDEIAIILVESTHTRSKGRFTCVAPFRKLYLP